MPNKKAPAAAGKTSPSLIHVTKSRNFIFVCKKAARKIHVTKSQECLSLPNKKVPAAAGKTLPA